MGREEEDEGGVEGRIRAEGGTHFRWQAQVGHERMRWAKTRMGRDGILRRKREEEEEEVVVLVLIVGLYHLTCKGYVYSADVSMFTSRALCIPKELWQPLARARW